MNFDSELYYLKDTRTGKYHSASGLTSDVELATKFTELQLKNRLGVPKTYTNVFREKLKNGFLAMVPVNELKEAFLNIKSDLEYTDDDILFCDATFHFEGGKIKKTVVYSVWRNNLRVPDGKGKYLGCDLNVIRVVGKVNPD